MQDFLVVARAIETFVVEVRGSQNWVIKLMKWADTQKRLESFQNELQQVAATLQFGATVNTYSFLQTAKLERDKLENLVQDLQVQHKCASMAELVKVPEACQQIASECDCL